MRVRKFALQVVVVAATASLSSGCTSTSQTLALAEQVPADYKSQIVQYLAYTLKDPYSVRGAEISRPTSVFVGLVNGGNVPGVCLRFNAKNSFGAYAGAEVMIAGFKNGRIFGVGEPVLGGCAAAVYEPFPELEQSEKKAS